MKKLWILLTILLALQAGLLFFYFSLGKSENAKKTDGDFGVLNTFFEGSNFYETAKKAGKEFAPNAQKKDVLAGIIPHHLVAADKIAAFFEGLRGKKFDTVVLVSPNHHNFFSKELVISGANWNTPYGLALGDKKSAVILSEFENAEYTEDRLLEREHEISFVLPFVKDVFPDAKMIYVLARQKTDRQVLDDFLEKMETVLDGRSMLFLVSADFSHDAPATEADRRDKISNAIIQNWQTDEYEKIYVDSPEAVYMGMKYAWRNGATEAELLWNTNSGRIIGKPEEPTVSHNFYYFWR